MAASEEKKMDELDLALHAIQGMKDVVVAEEGHLKEEEDAAEGFSAKKVRVGVDTLAKIIFSVPTMKDTAMDRDAAPILVRVIEEHVPDDGFWVEGEEGDLMFALLDCLRSLTLRTTEERTKKLLDANVPSIAVGILRTCADRLDAGQELHPKLVDGAASILSMFAFSKSLDVDKKEVLEALRRCKAKDAKGNHISMLEAFVTDDSPEDVIDKVMREEPSKKKE